MYRPNRGIVGALTPGALNGKAPKQYGTDRRCRCGTRLATYTKGEWCNTCQDNETRRERFASQPSESYMLFTKSKTESDVRTYRTSEVAAKLFEAGIIDAPDGARVKTIADGDGFAMVKRGSRGVSALFNADEVDAYINFHSKVDPVQQRVDDEVKSEDEAPAPYEFDQQPADESEPKWTETEQDPVEVEWITLDQAAEILGAPRVIAEEAVRRMPGSLVRDLEDGSDDPIRLNAQSIREMAAAAKAMYEEHMGTSYEEDLAKINESTTPEERDAHARRVIEEHNRILEEDNGEAAEAKLAAARNRIIDLYTVALGRYEVAVQMLGMAHSAVAKSAASVAKETKHLAEAQQLMADAGLDVRPTAVDLYAAQSEAPQADPRATALQAIVGALDDIDSFEQRRELFLYIGRMQGILPKA